MHNKLKAGSVLMRNKGLVTHEGVYLGNGQVVHTTPETGVCVVTVDEFCQNQPLKIDLKRIGCIRAINQRLKAIKKSSYSLLHWNCQHLSNYLINGKVRSTQLQLTTTGLFLGAALGASRKSNMIPYALGAGLLGCLIYNHYK